MPDLAGRVNSLGELVAAFRYLRARSGPFQGALHLLTGPRNKRVGRGPPLIARKENYHGH